MNNDSLGTSKLESARVAPKHLPQLDVLRGVAIVGVLLFHCLGTIYYKDELPWAGNWRAFASEPRISFYLFYPLTFGWVGVALFFVLSGFVIHYSQMRDPNQNVLEFYRRRFWRIYPPYLLALVVFTGLAAMKGAAGPWLAKQFAMHALMVHNLDSKSIYELCPAFWSLAVEMQFYLLYPLVLAIRSRTSMKKTLGIILAVSAASQLVLCLVSGSLVPDSAPMAFATPSLWFDWVLGAYLAEEFLAGRRVFSRPILAILALAVLFVGSTFYRPASALSFTIACLLGAVILEMAVWSAGTMGRGMRGLAWLGVISYSFYLWHQPLLPLLAKALHLGGPSRAGVQMVILFTGSLVVISVWSWLLYWGVEKPSHRIAKRGWAWRKIEYRAPLEVVAASEAVSS